MTLNERFDSYLHTLALPPGKALVAVSGGPHSLALLDLLVHAPSARELALIVAHVDHGIHPESAAVAASVAEVARRYGLPLESVRLELGPGASETVARRHRYAWFRERLDTLDARLVFTAHHLGDQLETILMRVLKGSGPAGLAGIPVRRGPFVRPVLPFPGEELEQHAREVGFTPWTDPANRDPRQLRSRLRHDILPRLRDLVPGLQRSLLRLAWQARDARAAWQALLPAWSELEYRAEGHIHSVAVPPLQEYDSALARGVIHALARRAGMQVTLADVARIHRLVRLGDTGRVLQLPETWRAELSFGRLRLFQEVVHPPEAVADASVEVAGSSGRARLGAWEVCWGPDTAPSRLERAGTVSWFSPAGSYRIRFWAPGDRVRPLRGGGSRLVVRCMQDARVPRSERAGWPVLEQGGTIVWVPGVCRADEARPETGAPALRIDARRA